MEKPNLSRRGFLQGTGVAAVSLAAASMLASCGPNGKAQSAKSSETAEGAQTSYEPSETIDVDIVVVGSGFQEWPLPYRPPNWAPRRCSWRRARKRAATAD